MKIISHIMPKQKIELNRRFASLSEGPTGLHVEVYLRGMQGINRSITWEKLLESSGWIVVLGEAGIGKSTEFTLKSESLRRQNTLAFLMDISDLAEMGPESAIPHQDIPLLRTWRHEEKQGIFFLDSLDVAQLHGRTLKQALRKLSKYIGDARSRAQIIVSCRVSDWNTASGEEAMHEYICESGGNEKDLNVVQLMPLDNEQVKQLLVHYGAGDADRLLQSVCDDNARALIARPLDVEWLVSYWNEHNKIGSLSELIESNVTRRLNESRPTALYCSPLAKEKAREGIMKLAVLAVLCGRWSFLIPGEKHIGVEQRDIIDPRDALAWSDIDIKELLTRAIFDESMYGCVRFYHQTVQEYLASKWIQNKIKDRLLCQKLGQLFFKKAHGRLFVPTHLLPTVKWLSLWNMDVRNRLIEIEPQALIQHGVPAQYPKEVRERALSAYLKRYTDRERLYDNFDRYALKRFASGLETAVYTHLNRNDLPSEAIGLLLELATEGKFRSCNTKAIAWSVNSTADSLLRSRAFRAVAFLASEDEKRSLVNLVLENQHSWDQNIAGVFASHFFPSIFSTTEVGQLLRCVVPEASNYHTTIKSFVTDHLPFSCPKNKRLSMLRELMESIYQTNYDHAWLLHGIQKLSLVFIKDMSPNEEPADELKEALTLLKTSRESPWYDSAISDELWRAIVANPLLHSWYECSSQEKSICVEIPYSDQIQNSALPKPTDWDSEIRKEREERALKELEIHANFIRILNENIHSIRMGTHRALLSQIYLRAELDSGEMEVVLEKVHKKFGQEIAIATVSGLKACWREWNPPFRFEQEKWNLIPGDVMIGLAGLQLEFEAGLNPSYFNELEVELATRYAVRQIQGFPLWFKDLSCAHPDKVLQTLSPAIQADFDFRPTTDSVTRLEILNYRCKQLPDPIQKPMATAVLRELMCRDPHSEDALDNALHICNWLTPDELKSFINLCIDKLYKVDSLHKGVLWWLALAHKDPIEAIFHLEDFAEEAEQEHLDAVVEAICYHFSRRSLLSRERERVTHPFLKNAKALIRLIPIVFRSIRHEEDKKDDPSEAHFVTPRHFAEDFRTQLLGCLITVGTAADFEMLAMDPRMSCQKDILLRYAQNCLQQSVQARPMSFNEALDWSKKFLAPVRTADDLFNVVLDCLSDIKACVETGEFSIRSAYVSDDETSFQLYFADQFEQRNQYAYTVHREEEVDRQKKPDIRIYHSVCSTHPITIEVKVAENWPLSVLCRALDDQLVGGYMRAHKSRHGIFLLCSRPKEKNEEKQKRELDNKELNLQETVEFLQEKANELISKRSEIDALSVIGIDFH